MTATAAPFGFRVLRNSAGGEPRLSAVRYTITAGTTGAIYSGDLVKNSGSGNAIVVGAAADTAFAGVFAGVNYKDAQGKIVFSPYWPSGGVSGATEIEALVYDLKNNVFAVQCDDVLAAADLGATTDISTATAGSAVTGQSGMAITTNSLSGGNVKIIQVLDRPDNVLGDAFPIVEVEIAEQEGLTGV